MSFYESQAGMIGGIGCKNTDYEISKKKANLAQFAAESNAIQREGEISRGFDSLEKTIQVHAETVHSLLSRLSPVLSPEPPTSTGQTARDETSPRTQMGARLRSLEDRVRQITMAVSAINGLVEL